LRDARLFGKDSDDIRASDFADRCDDDRHHFRFIVSPEDAPEMSDLRAFARDLMGQMESDLGTKLDWVAVDHWNTAHPHLHVIVRGVAEDGSDLVIARDYTWLDRQAIAREPLALASTGFGAEVKEAMEKRTEHLVEQGLASRDGGSIR